MIVDHQWWYATVSKPVDGDTAHTNRAVFTDPKIAWDWICAQVGLPQGSYDDFMHEDWADDEGVIGGGTVVSMGVSTTRFTACVRLVTDESTCDECGHKMLD